MLLISRDAPLTWNDAQIAPSTPSSSTLAPIAPAYLVLSSFVSPNRFGRSYTLLLVVDHHKEVSDNAHLIYCSRERSRAAWKIIEEYLMPFVEKECYQLSSQCKLHPDNDMFRDQEQHKNRVDLNEWRCEYCKKSFYEEKYLDKHFDNRHYHFLNTGGLLLWLFLKIFEWFSARRLLLFPMSPHIMSPRLLRGRDQHLHQGMH